MSGAGVDTEELRRAIERVEAIHQSGLAQCAHLRQALERYDAATQRFGADSATAERMRLELRELVERLVELASTVAEE